MDARRRWRHRLRRQQRLERRRVAREEAPREAQGVHVDAVCFARAARDDEQPAAADEQVVRLAVQQIEVVQQQRVGPQQRVGEGAVRREVLRAIQSVSRVDREAPTPSPQLSPRHPQTLGEPLPEAPNLEAVHRHLDRELLVVIR